MHGPAKPRAADSVGRELRNRRQGLFIYIAPSEDMIRAHAQQGGFPANRISEIKTVIDPTTAEGHGTAAAA